MRVQRQAHRDVTVVIRVNRAKERIQLVGLSGLAQLLRHHVKKLLIRQLLITIHITHVEGSRRIS